MILEMLHVGGTQKMRKFIVAMLFMTLLTGCAQNPIDESPDPDTGTDTPALEKTDSSKPWIYTEKATEENAYSQFLESLGEDGYEQYFEPDWQEMLEPFNQEKELLSTDKITLNFVSDDANTIQKLLDDYSEKAEDFKSQQQRRWGSFVSLSIEETESTVSLIVFYREFIVSSDAGSEFYEAYVFSKETGNLLLGEDILNVAGFAQNDVVSAIETNLETRFTGSSAIFDSENNGCENADGFDLCTAIKSDYAYFIRENKDLAVITETKWLTEETLNPNQIIPAVFFVGK